MAGLILVVSQMRIFMRLKRKLPKADYNTFIDLLGDQYRSRPIDAKTRRYKWSKGIFTIKATFDDDGSAVGDVSITRKTKKQS